MERRSPMDASFAQTQDVGSDSGYVTKFDGVPGFWNYLLDLDRKDLIAELIQNDLDQGATRTEIAFEKDRLICFGNGKPVEADGWERLSMMLGAGNSVPAKRKKIGVKNHGLKTAFKIGDEFELSSAGQRIIQTLFRDGRDKPAYPGASSKPTNDPDAPLTGCRIVIPYRTVAVRPPHGEASVISSPRDQDIKELFETACARVPEQFSGIVSPHTIRRYQITLRHWQLGEAQFVFSCTRPQKRKGRRHFELFRRHCAVAGTAGRLPKGLSEQAIRRWVPLQGRFREGNAWRSVLGPSVASAWKYRGQSIRVVVRKPALGGFGIPSAIRRIQSRRVPAMEFISARRLCRTIGGTRQPEMTKPTGNCGLIAKHFWWMPLHGMRCPPGDRMA